jgi:hypothetical protein
MSNSPDQPTNWKFSFIPEFADCIARIASCWARLEYDMNASIWSLAETRPAYGACITSQIYTTQGRLNAILALGKLRKLDNRLMKRLNKFSDKIRIGQDVRNRTLHDIWLQDRLSSATMGHLVITANRILEMKIKSVDLKELRDDLEKVEDTQAEFEKIRRAIDAVLPSLPEMSQTELHPIVETPQ